MGWAIGYDAEWSRDIGYGVPAICDHPGCNAEIHRGLAHVCGGEPYGGDLGCGLYFCEKHLYYTGLDENASYPQRCVRCCDNELAFNPKPDTEEWMRWKLTQESWALWRSENPDDVAAIRKALGLRLKEGKGGEKDQRG